MSPFDAKQYKQTQKEHWNHNASHYHEGFVARRAGPFQAVDELVGLTQVSAGGRALDVATGTGVVALTLAPRVGPQGRVVGVDLSPGMLALARQQAQALPWVEFVEGDAEALEFAADFDAVTCQFGLMFFPDCQAALRGMRRALKPGGRLALSVHGRPENVPYFTAFMEAALATFPELQENAGPGPLRFSDGAKLQAELEAAGFEDVQLHGRTYELELHDLDEYWERFLNTAPRPFVASIEGLSSAELSALRRRVQQNLAPCQRDDGLCFPWEVTLATARELSSHGRGSL